MSLSVKSLNGDTTFLLTFSPLSAPDHARDRLPGAFTILVDPWLAGSSSIWNPSFQISHHTSRPCASSLADIVQPDLILISQAKPDHCHKETLCTLPRESRTRIIAVPDAAKMIKSWSYFNNIDVATLQTFNSRKQNETVYRIPIESYTPNTASGEVTLSFIPQKYDMTGLHNAVGITYRPPGTSFISKDGMKIVLPTSPPATPARSRRNSRSKSRDEDLSVTTSSSTASSTPDSPMSGQLSPAMTTTTIPDEQAISVLYTPHGMSYTALAPYVETHLQPLDALPLTALMHSINVEQNPWLLGGLVARGFPGGLDLVRKIGAKNWISAHDEAKDNKGWATAWITSRAYGIEEAQEMLDAELESEQAKTKIVELASGEQFKAC